MSAVIVLVFFLVLSLLGFPIAFSLGIATMLFAILLDVPLTILSQTVFASIDNFSYIAIPLFILVGNLMDSGGLSKRLVRFCTSFLKRIPGSLGAINVMSCAFFGAISGSASATTAAIGGMLVPEMVEKKYSPGYAGALSAIAGTLGAIIPPSVTMIIYAIAAEVSVTDMFIAGFLPGIIVAIGFIVVNIVYSLVTKVDITDKSDKVSLKEIGSTFWDAKWALLTPVIILGGIYSGIFTATEAAVVACIYSFIVGCFIYKEINMEKLFQILLKTSKTVGAILIIIPFAIALGRLLTISLVPQTLGMYVLSKTSNPNTILVIVVGIVFIAGMFIDSAPIILILTPLFLPMLKTMGVSPIHFGIILTLGAMVGTVTPPVGVNLFVGQGIAKVDTLTIVKYALIFIAEFMVVYLFIVFNPWISTCVVNTLA